MLTFIKRLLKSIALLPSVMALCFLTFAIVLIAVEIPYKNYPVLDNFSVSTKADIQSILAFVIGGIFTLTIFSYTMVMNVLNRNINNYSPRLIPLILAERHHQLILGFTTGTIIYSMVLAIANSNDDLTYFPSIAAPLAVVFSIICVLLYIYFLHSVSQSIHVNYIIKEVYNDSKQNLKLLYESSGVYKLTTIPELSNSTVFNGDAGYLHFYKIEALFKTLKSHDITMYVVKAPGAFVYTGDVVFRTNKKLSSDLEDEIWSHLSIDYTVSSDVFVSDVKHLVEVAIKASSPAINDPGTSLNVIHYLTQIFLDKLAYDDFNTIEFEGVVIYFSQVTNQLLCKLSYTEMYHYMKDDPILVEALKSSIKKLHNKFPHISWLNNSLLTK
ncbi:MAG: DUF2254 domain-containing protein [Nonlabens sp.]|nr:DUF2254 domain-containing protein [Nonlabens sp.]